MHTSEQPYSCRVSITITKPPPHLKKINHSPLFVSGPKSVLLHFIALSRSEQVQLRIYKPITVGGDEHAGPQGSNARSINAHFDPPRLNEDHRSFSMDIYCDDTIPKMLP